MKSGNIQKINGLGKAGYVICKIGKIALTIAVVVGLVCGILMCFVPKNAVVIELQTTNSAIVHVDQSLEFFGIVDLDMDDGFLEIGESTYQVVVDGSEEPAMEKRTLHLSDVKWILFFAVFVCAAAWIPFHFAGKLCAYFKDCDTPFSEESAKALVQLAWSMIPVCVLAPGMEALVGSLMAGNFDILVSIDLPTVLLILCVFMLSYIFKHGAALQIESDETL